MADATRLHERIYLSDPWDREPVEVVVMGRIPDNETAAVRDRATLALHIGAVDVQLRPKHSECLALAAMLTKLADTIPEGLRS